MANEGQLTGAADGAEPTGLVANIQRFSLHDGGGIRTVAFLKGCPFRCPWCCNPEDISFEPEVSFSEKLCIHCSPLGADGLCVNAPERCPTGAKRVVGEPYTVERLVDALARDRTFFEESGGGVTLSGGECLSGRNQAFTMAVAEKCHEVGLSTAIETTLAVPLTDVARLVAAVDVFLVDFKIADRARSLDVIGLDPELRDDNLRRVLALDGHVVARMPIIPGFTDDQENVAANVARVQELGIARVDVLPFHQLGESKYASIRKKYDLGGVKALHDEDVSDVVETCRNAGLKVSIHG